MAAFEEQYLLWLQKGFDVKIAVNLIAHWIGIGLFCFYLF